MTNETKTERTTPVLFTQRRMISMMAHAANREYCHHIGDPVPPEWDACTAEHQNSICAGVANLDRMMLEKETIYQSANHESWMAQKIADGWRYGDVKDEAAKTHPCLLDFAYLPAKQQAKDALFIAIVTALLKVKIKDIVTLTPIPIHQPGEKQ